MIHDLIGFVILVVDKMASNGAGSEGTASINCSLTELHRKDHRCNFTHQTVGLWASVYHIVVVLLNLKWNIVIFGHICIYYVFSYLKWDIVGPNL